MILIESEDGEKYFDKTLIYNLKKHDHTAVLSVLKTVEDAHTLVDSTGSTLLHYAAEENNGTVGAYLINKGSDVDALNEEGKSPLKIAVTNNYFKLVRLMLDKIDFTDDSTVLKSLYEQGARAPSPDVIGVFMDKIIEMCNDDDDMIARKLVSVGCAVEKVISLGKPMVTRRMLEAGTPVDKVNVFNKRTALHKAVEWMDLENIKVLVEHGANVNARCEEGTTPIYRLDTNYKDINVQIAIATYLIENGASVTIEDYYGYTPLTSLFPRSDREIIQLLVDQNVNMNLQNRFRLTPLHYLMKNKKSGVLEPLRGKNVNLEVRDTNGDTPLIMAVRKYDLEKTEFLLEEGADVNVRDSLNYTALALLFAEMSENEKNVNELIDVLLQHGADPLVNNRKTVLHLAENNFFFYRIKPVIAQVVLLEALGKRTHRLIRQQIPANCVYNLHYDKCKELIQTMQCTIVSKDVSLFTILVVNQENLVLYARSEEFAEKFEISMASMDYMDRYINNTMRKKVRKAVEIAKLKREAAYGLCQVVEIMPLNADDVAYRITDFLDTRDLKILQQIYIENQQSP